VIRGCLHYGIEQKCWLHPLLSLAKALEQFRAAGYGCKLLLQGSSLRNSQQASDNAGQQVATQQQRARLAFSEFSFCTRSGTFTA
jgi:hypothetical protein